jgi:general stress protein 26
MTDRNPHAELDREFSSGDATPTPWADAQKRLEQSEIYWLSTVRPDGRPHVTPLIAVWHDGSLFFCTGAGERKAKNLVQNPHCILTTGTNAMHEEGLDLVVEGDAMEIHDNARLQRVANAYETKYGPEWHFTVRDGALIGGEGNVAVVYEVAPVTAFGFGKGAIFSQTRWKF